MLFHPHTHTNAKREAYIFFGYFAWTDTKMAETSRKVVKLWDGLPDIRKYASAAVMVADVKEIFTKVAEQSPDIKHYPIVADVDDTLLDGELASEGVLPCDPVVDFIKWAALEGWPVAVITARTEIGREWTTKQLKVLDIVPEALYMRPAPSTDPGPWKRQARQEVAEMYGRKILLSIGDQPWDVATRSDPCPVLDKAGLSGDQRAIWLANNAPVLVRRPDSVTSLGAMVSRDACRLGKK